MKKLPEDNYGVPGINMLRDKINEIIDVIDNEMMRIPPEPTCQHEKTYLSGVEQKLRCTECGEYL